MTRTRSFSASIVLALAMAAMIPLVHAHDRDRGGAHQVEHKGAHQRGDFTRRLNLSEAQRDQIFQLRHEAAPALRAKGKEVRSARIEARKVAMTENFDEKNAVAVSTRAAQAEAELGVMRLRLTNQIYNVLTPEQRKQAAEGRKHRFEHKQADAETAPAV